VKRLAKRLKQMAGITCLPSVAISNAPSKPHRATGRINTACAYGFVLWHSLWHSVLKKSPLSANLPFLWLISDKTSSTQKTSYR
jgi:hypothetical protein